MSSGVIENPGPDVPVVTQGQLWRQFLPLSLTDVTMAFADPLTTATLAHLPDTKANLAAVGVAKSLAVCFESPIIMVLHAANALAPTAASRRALWRFVLLAITVLSALLLVLTLPAVFNGVVQGLLGVPAPLAALSRSVLLLMFLWPAAIGWRRYFQGLLIHAGANHAVARASVWRLIIVAVALACGWGAGLPGAELAGMALAAGVITEAALVTLAARRYGVSLAAEETGTTRQVLPTDLTGVWRFYWPLANAMLVVWGGRALLVGLIARAVDGSVALAAWPAAWGLVLLIANATRMVQQVIIRHRELVPARHLLRFAAGVGLSCSAILAIISLVPAGSGWLAAFVGPHPELQAAVRPVLLLCLPVPLLVALQNGVQGLMISSGRTARVNAATLFGTAVLLAGTMTGLWLGLPGASAAALAMVLALIAELAWLMASQWTGAANSAAG
jgi:hypothetical protein